MKSPTEMTPDRLRLMANRCEMRGDPATAFVLRDLASAWEDDRKRLEAAEKVCRNAIARRHDLKGEIMGGYDSEMDAALDEWAAIAAEEERP